MSTRKKSCFLLTDRQKLRMLFKGVTRCIWRGLATSMMGCDVSMASKQAQRDKCLFTAHVLLLLTYVLAYLPCDVPMFTMCLVECWLVMWLLLVGYACFVLARCYLVALLHIDVCRVANQWVCSYRLEF